MLEDTLLIILWVILIIVVSMFIKIHLPRIFHGGEFVMNPELNEITLFIDNYIKYHPQHCSGDIDTDANICKAAGCNCFESIKLSHIDGIIDNYIDKMNVNIDNKQDFIESKILSKPKGSGAYINIGNSQHVYKIYILDEFDTYDKLRAMAEISMYKRLIDANYSNIIKVYDVFSTTKLPEIITSKDSDVKIIVIEMEKLDGTINDLQEIDIDEIYAIMHTMQKIATNFDIRLSDVVNTGNIGYKLIDGKNKLLLFDFGGYAPIKDKKIFDKEYAFIVNLDPQKFGNKSSEYENLLNTIKISQDHTKMYIP